MAGVMIFILTMKLTLFGSDVSDRDSESDSNNVVSAVTYYISSLKEETNGNGHLYAHSVKDQRNYLTYLYHKSTQQLQAVYRQL
jgi:hypothetical protein